MKDVNQLVICKEDYSTEEGFRNAIRDATMLLLNANYIIVTKYDEKGLGIVSLEYQYADQEFGCDYPYWLSPEEYESVITDEERKQQKENE